MNRVATIALLAALLGAGMLPAQTRNPLDTKKEEWLNRIMHSSGLPDASGGLELPQSDMPDTVSAPKAWDGQPQIVEEDVFDPPAPYFETAQFYRILTPISFTATKGEDYQKPTADGNAAYDYWRLFSGVPTRGSYDLFVAATKKRNCDFFAPGLMTDPFGYEHSLMQYPMINLFLGTQWRLSAERVRASGVHVKMDFCHQMLTMADHIDSQQMNMHWAWLAFYLRRLAANGLVQYYTDKGDALMAQKYQRFGAQSLTYYRTLRRRYEELSRAFVEGDIDQFHAYVRNGPNREITKELLLLSGIMLRVAEDLVTAPEIQPMGSMPGWPSVKVMRFTKINSRHYEGIYNTLKEVSEDPNADASVRDCAKWALTAEQASLESKLIARNAGFVWQVQRDPNESGL